MQPEQEAVLFTKRRPSSKRTRHAPTRRRRVTASNTVPSPPSTPPPVSSPPTRTQSSSSTHPPVVPQNHTQPQSRPRLHVSRFPSSAPLTPMPTPMSMPAPRYTAAHLDALRREQPVLLAQHKPPAPFTEAWQASGLHQNFPPQQHDKHPDEQHSPVDTDESAAEGDWAECQLTRAGTQIPTHAHNPITSDLSQIVHEADFHNLSSRNDMTKCRAVLKTCNAEWTAREADAVDRARRARMAKQEAETSLSLADKHVIETQQRVDMYDHTEKVFRHACTLLKANQQALRGFRDRRLAMLAEEADRMRIALQGTDEFGRVANGLSAADALAEEAVTVDTVNDEDTFMEFDVHEELECVQTALAKWREIDAEGYESGFGDRSGGQVLGRLSLGAASVKWTNLQTGHDTKLREAAIEASAAPALAGALIRARWQPRLPTSWSSLRDSCGGAWTMKRAGVASAVAGRAIWEIEGCVRSRDATQLRACLRGVDQAVADVGDEACGARLVECVRHARDVLARLDEG